MKAKLEIACFNVESCYHAEIGGADRIEFCAEFKAGGTTPNLLDYKEISQKIAIPIFVMIRPRGGNFVYSSEEFQQMKKSIIDFKNENAEGFVFGILNEDNEIDIERNTELIELAHPIPCSMHRAFDRTNDLEISLRNIKKCGFSTLLTSGMAKNVESGIENLKKLVELAKNIEIMPGGGLRSSNIENIKEISQARWFHSSAIVNGEICDVEEVRKLKEKIG